MAREAPEGIVFSNDASVPGGINYNDRIGDKESNFFGSQVLGLSKSQIETMDLLSEGPIQGLMSGIWVNSGQLGEIGWRTSTFSGFNIPTGFTGVNFLR